MEPTKADAIMTKAGHAEIYLSMILRNHWEDTELYYVFEMLDYSSFLLGARDEDIVVERNDK